MISIHAPTRGATAQPAPKEAHTSYFNPRSHEGSDGDLADHFVAVMVISIHAPTRGATLDKLNFVFVLNDFNPRSHEGSDRSIRRGGASGAYFNPRSHEGSDFRCRLSAAAFLYFNPRSHEGSDSNFRQKVLFSLSKNCLKYLILTTNYFN